MKFVFLFAPFLAAHLHVGFADARCKRTSLRRSLKKYKQPQDRTGTSGDSYFSYYYGKSGDFDHGKGHTISSGDNNSAESHTSTSEDSDPTNPVEGAADASGSNDSTYLERICDLYVDFKNSVSTNPCQSFERFDFLMCPEDYIIEGICTSSSGLSADLSDAIMNQYCLRFFNENLNASNGMLCSDLCNAFVGEADCCKVRCP